MWIFTTIGFFSVVQKKRQDNFLTVRARVAADLDNLRGEFMPGLSKTTDRGGSDYPFRATISHAEFADGLSKMVRAIDYGNFKSEVARKAGHGRAATYSKVWSVLHDLESDKA